MLRELLPRQPSLPSPRPAFEPSSHGAPRRPKKNDVVDRFHRRARGRLHRAWLDEQRDCRVRRSLIDQTEAPGSPWPVMRGAVAGDLYLAPAIDVVRVRILALELQRVASSRRGEGVAAAVASVARRVVVSAFASSARRVVDVACGPRIRSTRIDATSSAWSSSSSALARPRSCLFFQELEEVLEAVTPSEGRGTLELIGMLPVAAARAPRQQQRSLLPSISSRRPSPAPSFRQAIVV